MKRMMMTMSSGHTVEAVRVMLYPEHHVKMLADIRSEINSIRVMLARGGLAETVGGAIGVVAARAANNKSLDANIVKERNAFLHMKPSGRFFEVSTVVDIDRPDQSVWHSLCNYRPSSLGAKKERINLQKLNDDELGELCFIHKLDASKIYKSGFFGPTLLVDSVEVVVDQELINQQEIIDQKFVSDNDVFICVDTGDGIEWVRWGDVVRYRVADSDSSKS